MPGWTNSKNGPTGFMMGAAKGIVRRLPANRDLIYDYIPVDTVINELIVAAWHVGTTRYLNFMLSVPSHMLPHHLLHIAPSTPHTNTHTNAHAHRHKNTLRCKHTHTQFCFMKVCVVDLILFTFCATVFYT